MPRGNKNTPDLGIGMRGAGCGMRDAGCGKVSALTRRQIYMGNVHRRGKRPDGREELGVRNWGLGKVALLMQREINMGNVYRRACKARKREMEIKPTRKKLPLGEVMLFD